MRGRYILLLLATTAAATKSSSSSSSNYDDYYDDLYLYEDLLEELEYGEKRSLAIAFDLSSGSQAMES